MKHRVSDRDVISMFQRYLSSNDPSEINKLSAEDLMVAEVKLGLQGVDANFREAIRNKARDLEIKEARKHESKIRAWNLVTGLILGLVIAGVAAWLFGTYSI